ncbi:transposase family protein [Streptomyces clavifer]
MLAVLRCDQRPGDLAGGNGIHRTTVTRWVKEVVGLLAARTPRLDRPKGWRHPAAGRIGDPHPAQNREENRKNYSGENKCHGLLVIALTDDRGRLLWISAARPGRASEITACRHDKLTRKLRKAGLGAIADLGPVGLACQRKPSDPLRQVTTTALPGPVARISRAPATRGRLL